ncbi:hypothetical protein L596_027985 [Steinernema carpocapsae]|uniref:SSD domain-containing protein n=1 Tax=Steinernema carpocapsae TaxID=34508 RepID=A0A4U5LX66_STECR|nr:hypothetical protein L596_027985 [Steinernema carpocapsae]
MPNSHIVDFKNRYDDAIQEMQTMAYIVRNPGNLTNTTQMERVESLKRSFENASYSYGPESTFCWLNSYKEFRSILNEEEGIEVGTQRLVSNTANFNVIRLEFNYADITEFLSLSSYSFWAATLRTNAESCNRGVPECIEQFLCSTGFTTLVRYNELYPLVEEAGSYADQSQTLSTTIWQTSSALICMGIAFIILIPDLSSICGAIFSVLSVNVGVIGYLSLWGIGIDPLSMAAQLMSIGFSVDITAHISYHYYSVKDETIKTTRERLEHASSGSDGQHCKAALGDDRDDSDPLETQLPRHRLPEDSHPCFRLRLVPRPHPATSDLNRVRRPLLQEKKGPSCLAAGSSASYTCKVWIDEGKARGGMRCG